MLFNSVEFLIFFFVVIIVGNLLKNKTERIFLLLVSYYFYMSWNPNFIFLIISSTLLDYFVALQISKEGQSERKRKLFLSLSLIGNLGLLSYFKYTNFLLGIFNDLNIFTTYRFPKYEIILPVGISFYTFQSMSYTIDVYRKEIEAKKSIIDFSLYVAFFPQLVAGPIVRASTFFRDLGNRLTVTNEDIQISISRILLGFMRKLVFADNLGVVVNNTFANYQTMSPLEIWVGAIAFGWQIYFDFAGYTDIAIGVARLFGFQFDANFNFPMSCANISEHWTKWHISFSTWIRDYIFIPLGGSRGSTWLTYRNLYITWLFGGVWHGAAYHFVAWGVWQAVMVHFHREYARTKFRKTLNEKGGMAYDLFSRVITMFFLAFGFVMFRAENMTKAIGMMKAMLFIPMNTMSMLSFRNYNYAILLVICYAASYIFSKRNVEEMGKQGNRLIYANIASLFLILVFGATEKQKFLYFDF
ncbi:MAG: MBOAT family protein [Leptospiraceae bacterium]|nr:MBOAT family protein [Leptospiraceae bacterium]